MKHFFTFLAAVAAVSFGAQGESYKSVAVNLTDGTKVEVNLSDKLTAGFNMDNMLIADDTQSVSVPRVQIQSFTFSANPVSSIQEVNGGAAPVVEGGRMNFSDLPAGSRVAVYDMAGKLLMEQSAEGEFSLDLQSVPSAAVIVKVNEVAYKIATK